MDESKSRVMTQSRIFTLLMAFGAVAVLSCNNSSTTAMNSNDSTGDRTTANTRTSTGDYSAYADQIERNSAEGYYINPKNGKPYGKLTIDRNTGAITDQNGQPVWRYVDRRTWWVYGVDDDWNWEKLGEAKMDDNNQLLFRDDKGDWVTYDQRWSNVDENIDKTWKAKSGDVKIKFDKDGDIKYKEDSTRIKYDADDDQIKTDSSQ
jgi:hypothetical protein